MSKKPNKFLAPVVIAGVTIGFLASAYKFVFAKPDENKNNQQKHDVQHKSNEDKSD